MLFSSSIFILYFLPVFILIYLIIKDQFKNYFIVLASIVFYSWGAPKLVFLVILSVLLNYYITKKLHHSDDRSKRKQLLFLSVVINLGMLLYFKYANFFIENVNACLNNFGFEQIHWTNIALPIGISFFTFQSLSYTIDVYRKICKPVNNPIELLLYILLFPQLIAGPIIRYNNIADQIQDRKKNENIDNKLYGIYRFIIGLSKKVLIANMIGEKADIIFSMSPDNLNSSLAWIGVIAYSFQIYFDFSGYSDMAIGIGRIMGFKFPENFNNPYVSSNVTEFWQRWHISLSTWFRDYLFLPLAYMISKKLKKNQYYHVKTEYWIYILAITVTFFLCGFWHGAEWNFAVWGLYYGLFLILDKLFLKKLLSKIWRLASVLITYVIVLIGWVVFRIESLPDAFAYIYKMFRFDFHSVNVLLGVEFWVFFSFGALFSFITLFKPGLKLQDYFYKVKYNIQRDMVLFGIILILLVLSVSYITSGDFNPFIYFRF